MIEIKINRKNLKKFIQNIRREDKEELIYYFGKNYKSLVIKTILKDCKNTYFIADNNYFPLAIGGALEIEENKAQIWLLCSNTYSKHTKEIYKYVKNKLLNFIQKYEILFNYIYESNFKADLWLKKFNFIFKNTTNPKIKLFYLLKEEKNLDL